MHCNSLTEISKASMFQNAVGFVGCSLKIIDLELKYLVLGTCFL